MLWDLSRAWTLTYSLMISLSLELYGLPDHQDRGAIGRRPPLVLPVRPIRHLVCARCSLRALALARQLQYRNFWRVACSVRVRAQRGDVQRNLLPGWERTFLLTMCAFADVIGIDTSMNIVLLVKNLRS